MSKGIVGTIVVGGLVVVAAMTARGVNKESPGAVQKNAAESVVDLSQTAYVATAGVRGVVESVIAGARGQGVPDGPGQSTRTTSPPRRNDAGGVTATTTATDGR